MTNKISTVFIDLDGVMVDWLNGIRKSLKLPESFYAKYMDEPHLLSRQDVDDLFGGREAFEKVQRSRNREFWLNLELFPWAEELLAKMAINFPIAFLTSPGACPVSAQAKIEWRDCNFPTTPIMICRDKYLAAGPGKVLIDDEEGQLRRFKEAGGLALEWPNQFKLACLSEGEVSKLINGMVKWIKEYEQKI